MRDSNLFDCELNVSIGKHSVTIRAETYLDARVCESVKDNDNVVQEEDCELRHMWLYYREQLKWQLFICIS